MAMAWWHWAVLGLALVLAELVVPSFVLVWFGVGALGVSALVWLFPAVSLVTQIAVLIGTALVLLWLWFRVVKPTVFKTRIGQADANIAGQVGLLINDVAPFQPGRVRLQRPFLGADVWDCVSDEALKAGDRVRVLAVEGSILKIGKNNGSSQ